MEWLNKWNDALGYIEDHLDNKIDYEKLAKIASCSSFHFRRMFSYIANISLGEYVKKRRMTKAAFDLQSTNEKIIDIAFKYGYDSPTSFNRAFQSVHGMPPKKAREKSVVLTAFPRITIKISVKGEVEMKYKIVTKQAFNAVGLKRHYEMDIEENFMDIPLFWQQAVKDGLLPRLSAINSGDPCGILGISTCMNGVDFDYYIAVATEQKTPDDMISYTVPSCTWAVFDCVGAMPNSIQDLQKRIVSEWLPSSGYEYANAPDIEVYPPGDQFSSNYRCEVWLPITKK
jgi:AraC family transcriptional regulator